MLPSPPAEMNYPPTSKRKRSDIEAAEQDNLIFSLTNLVSNSTVSFEPLSRLLRAHLPLSWLAASTAHDHLLPGSLLQGPIPSFQGWDYAVLVARELPNGGLVVLEKIEDCCFVVQRLKPFVNEKWIQDAAIGASPVVSLQMMMHYLPVPEPDCQTDLDRAPDASSESTPKFPKPRRGAAARLSILSQPSNIGSSTSSPQIENFATNEETLIGETLQEEVKPPSAVESEAPPSALRAGTPGLDTSGTSALPSMDPQQDMLSPAYLRQRYLDHLYMTKTSLAYYTKGPLSRARARARAPDSSLNLADLAEFYRNSILPVKRIDLKYKESIKHVLLDQKPQVTDSGPSRKSSRKTKLGKDGLWPMEPEFITRWWETRALGPPISQDQHSQDLHDAISSLRMREAQMQMVLMLEALSIEAKQKDTVQAAAPLPDNADVKVESVEQDLVTRADKLNLKKPRNLEADLEVIADRLCIWHSIGLEGSGLLTERAVKTDEDDHNNSKDRLRHFCTDVLIPFYSSKLPLICKTLCRTLAGPEVFEQAQKASRLKDASKMMAPGAVVNRRIPSMNEKDFTRVLSENGIRQASAPALVRSSTLPPLPKFKREASELSQRPPSRNSRQPSVNLASREIDLVADAKATASKKRKLDRVMSHKQDLAAAIEALKKPNRHNVSNAYMDEVELRKPEVKKQAVHIAATPRVNRKSTLDGSEARHVVQPVFSRDQAIPSSSHKSGIAGPMNFVPRSSAKKQAVLAAIHSTPSKGTDRTLNSLHFSGDSVRDPVATPDANDKSVFIFSTPVKARPKESATSASMMMTPDPFSRGESESVFDVPDMALRTMARAMAMPAASTIYDTLGWNDDYDS